MARDVPHAGQMRERVTFLKRALDANQDPLGPFQPHFTCQARVEGDPGPMRVQAQRLEGQNAIVLTIRASRDGKGVTPDMRFTWALFPERTYLVKAVVMDLRRAWVEVWGVAYAGGPGG